MHCWKHLGSIESTTTKELAEGLTQLAEAIRELDAK
jgi:hypothetical protein